jgi:pseudaminic acid cytidylyltransferase
MNIAIIPARGKSKRIPQKNIKTFAGKPMICHSIDAALSANLFDRVIVSTDDPEIASIASEHGASAPFLRPNHISDDHAPIFTAVRHAIEWVENNIGNIDLVCCIYATAPLLLANDLRRGRDLLIQTPDANLAVAVAQYSYPTQRALVVREGKLSLMNPQYELTRSQDLTPTYHDAGLFYWGPPSTYKNSDWIISRTIPIEIPAHRVQDIDTPEDWVRAELAWKLMNETTFDREFDSR